jgi:hypothetical protein
MFYAFIAKKSKGDHLDLIEQRSAGSNRHPWELSRARCVLNIVKTFNVSSVADIGAGDRFFTAKLSAIASDTVYAVDRGYDAKEFCVNNILCFNDISALPQMRGGGGGVAYLCWLF